MFRSTAAVILLCLWGAAAPALGQGFFSRDDLLGVSPRADPALVQALVDRQAALDAHRINSRLRVSHFLAQIMTETGGLRRLDENMNYSAARLNQVFSRRVITPEKARQIAGNPQAIANWVYRDRLGNGSPESGDGWAYRGSGYIQLTGRTNYRMRGEETGLPLERQPDMVRQPGPGLEAAVAYWSARALNGPADLNDRRTVRRLVNGPRMEGLDQAILWHNRIWTRLYSARPPFPNETEMLEAAEADLQGEDDEALRRILTDRGFAEAGDFESGDAAEAQASALRDYQESMGLAPTGILDDDTFYAITDPSEWRSFEEADLAAASPLIDADLGVRHSLAAQAATATETAAALAPEQGSGVPDAEALNPDELAALGAANGTYSAYETAEGRFVGGNFIPFTVIGEDEREAILDTRAFPSRAVVQILFRKRAGLGQNLCSGAMVAPDLVLTAGHCVHGGTTMGRWYSDFDIFPARNTGSKPFGACRALSLYALQGWTSSTSVSDARLYDLGAIKLDCRVGERTGWFGIAPLPDAAFGRPATVQGYAADKAPAGRQWISFDRFRALETDKGFYENDTFGGTSGSPVYSEQDYHITCVHTNGLHGSGNWARYNACTRITPQRLRTIIGWIGD